MVLVFTILFGFFSLAQAQYSEQPLPESTTDLRSQLVLFSIEVPSHKKTYLLERTANQDYFLRLKEKKEEVIKKIAGREATRMDRDFASRFLKCQYELENTQGECDVTLRLTMKGESQEICRKDDKKNQEIEVFVQELAKRF